MALKAVKQKVKSTDEPVSREPRSLRKERFLSGAAEVFAERGLHQATMDQVAAHLGVSKIILYRYFASKDDLISSILERVVERCLKVNHRRTHEFGSGTRDALKGARENPHAFLILLRHAPHDPIFGHYYETVLNDIRGQVESNIKKTPGNKDLTEEFVRLSVEAASTFALGSLTWWMKHGDEAQDEEFIYWNAGALWSFLNPPSLINIARTDTAKPVKNVASLKSAKKR